MGERTGRWKPAIEVEVGDQLGEIRTSRLPPTGPPADPSDVMEWSEVIKRHHSGDAVTLETEDGTGVIASSDTRLLVEERPPP